MIFRNTLKSVTVQNRYVPSLRGSLLAIDWMLAASLSHLAESCSGWSVLTLTVNTQSLRLSHFAASIHNTIAFTMNPIHPLTHFIHRCTHTEVVQGSGFYIVSSSRRLYVGAVAVRSSAGWLNASGETVGGKGSTTCKVSVNATARVKARFDG